MLTELGQEPPPLDATPACVTASQALAHACGAVEPARAAQVMEHLAACADCRTLVVEASRALVASHAPTETFAGADRSRTARAHTLAPGVALAGRYRVVRFLGAGGMGEVYEAVDAELDLAVAVKTVRLASLDQPEAIARFKAEVQLSRRVTHANVCRIFELGVHEPAAGGGRDGRQGGDPDRIPFYTMELLCGETLAQRLRREGRLPRARALPIFEGVMNGLAAAHAAGVIHRDLKGDNVFLARTDRGDGLRVVLMDFGLARFALAAPGAPGGHSLAGTPAYMAPEQRAGQPATAASDIYALGVMFHEVLTGQLPGDRAIDGLDAWWARVIQRCLAPRPEDRYRTVAELQRDLGARRPGWHRYGLLGLGVALAGSGLAFKVGAAPEPPPRPPVVVARSLAEAIIPAALPPQPGRLPPASAQLSPAPAQPRLAPAAALVRGARRPRRARPPSATKPLVAPAASAAPAPAPAPSAAPAAHADRPLPPAPHPDAVADPFRSQP